MSVKLVDQNKLALKPPGLNSIQRQKQNMEKGFMMLQSLYQAKLYLKCNEQMTIHTCIRGGLPKMGLCVRKGGSFTTALLSKWVTAHLPLLSLPALGRVLHKKCCTPDCFAIFATRFPCSVSRSPASLQWTLNSCTINKMHPSAPRQVCESVAKYVLFLQFRAACACKG